MWNSCLLIANLYQKEILADNHGYLLTCSAIRPFRDSHNQLVIEYTHCYIPTSLSLQVMNLELRTNIIIDGQIGYIEIDGSQQLLLIADSLTTQTNRPDIVPIPMTAIGETSLQPLYS